MINADNTHEFRIDAIVEQALKLVGMMALEESASGPQWNLRAAFGRTQLEVILKTLPNEATILRRVEFYTVTLDAAEMGSQDDPITLPEDTIDVLGDGMYLRSGDTSETRVRQIDRETWHTSANKAEEGAPRRMFVDREGSSVKLYLLPLVTSSDIGTLRVMRNYLAANSTQGQYTPDAERYWMDYLQWELGSRFAAGTLPLQAADARKRAAAALAEALGKAKTQVAPRARYRHRTGWHGR